MSKRSGDDTRLTADIDDVLQAEADRLYPATYGVREEYLQGITESDIAEREAAAYLRGRLVAARPVDPVPSEWWEQAKTAAKEAVVADERVHTIYPGSAALTMLLAALPHLGLTVVAPEAVTSDRARTLLPATVIEATARALFAAGRYDVDAATADRSWRVVLDEDERQAWRAHAAAILTSALLDTGFLYVEYAHRNASGGGSIHATLADAEQALQEWVEHQPAPVDEPPAPVSTGIRTRLVADWQPHIPEAS